MARKKKSGAPKPPQSTGSTSAVVPTKAATAPKGADAKGPAPAGSAAVAAPVVKEVDTRPETSPYGSLSCTVPFSSPLTVPLDVLKKCPKLHAAYESQLPELQDLSEDVGHILIHFLHTGTYESLKPKPTGSMSKQICELRTSIQAYAAARTYDLPELMRLAEAKIDKHSKGLSLPALLEVARDAYPNLTDGDDWFLDYLRSRIRPHLKDPKSLLASNLLDQISGILSPNRVLLRTVLELFCERIAVRPEPAPSSAVSAIASPITSPATSRAVSPLPPASHMSTLEMRSRSILREEFPPARKSLKATPWPSPDNTSEASWSRSTSSEPVNLPETTTPPQFEAKPVPEPAPIPVPASVPFADLGPVIVDVVPPPGPSIKAKVEPLPEVTPDPEPETKAAVEPEVKVAVETEAETAVEPVAKTDAEPAAEPEAKAAAEEETKVAVELAVDTPSASNAESQPEVSAEPQAEVSVDKEPTAPAELKPEPCQSAEIATTPVPVIQRERKDSGKEIDLGPIPKDLDSAPELTPKVEIGSNSQPQVRIRVLREADSGFWEGPDVEPAKESAPSVVGLEPVAAAVPEPAHELEATTPRKEPGVDARDFANPDPVKTTATEEPVDASRDASKGTIPVKDDEAPASVSTAELPATKPEPEPATVPPPEHTPAKVDDSATTLVVPEVASVDEQPVEAKNKEVEAQPETEKVPKESVEPKAVEDPEHEPKATTSDSIDVPDDAQPTGSSEAKTAQPAVEPGSKPPGEQAVLHPANTDSAVHAGPVADDTAKPPAVLGTKPAPEQAGAKAEADHAGAQLCSAHVRQRSWKKRFLSLRYPVFFGRGM